MLDDGFPVDQVLGMIEDEGSSGLLVDVGRGINVSG